ncbi:MAG: hypothetical protein AAGH19_05895 [Pseudomonadota bacterium]
MTIPLDPGMGGRSVDEQALQIGDVIVSTTPALISRVIRKATGSVVSHAIAYIGGGQVVEAIADGVVLRSLRQALMEATLAAAYRKPGLGLAQGLQIRDFLGQQLGKPYDYSGIVGQAGFQLDRRVLCVEGTIDCVRRVGNNNMRLQRFDKFFCSELVAAAYRRAGVPLTPEPPSWVSPDDIAKMRLSGNLEYVGHLCV